MKRLLNVSQLYSIPQFLRASFEEVNYNERAFITLKEQKKKIYGSTITFPGGYWKNMNIFNEKSKNGL